MIAAFLASTEEVEVQNTRSEHFIRNDVRYARLGETVRVVGVGISASQCSSVKSVEGYTCAHILYETSSELMEV